jgi:hypothetical protein
LLYTTSQLVFECETRKYCESNDNSQDDSYLPISSNLKRYFSTPSIGQKRFSDLERYFDPLIRWYNWVNDYSARDITHKDDIFPALSGLAREFQSRTGNTYAASIWKEEIYTGLLWERAGGGKPTEAYHAPSWSWAALDRVPESKVPLYYINRMIEKWTS